MTYTYIASICHRFFINLLLYYNGFYYVEYLPYKYLNPDFIICIL